jgi:hypothetical protein
MGNIPGGFAAHLISIVGGPGIELGAEGQTSLQLEDSGLNPGTSLVNSSGKWNDEPRRHSFSV